MSAPQVSEWTSWILAQRPPKNAVDPWRPYATLVEPEYTRDGVVEDVATIFLSNRECPFRCLMCDLWKNTLDERTPEAAIPAQIDWALARLPRVRHVKLYNAGNFFDAQAVPVKDLPAIADRLAALQTVIVECHPRLVGRRCIDFQAMLRPALQVAMGLETVNPDVLPRLNKQMQLSDFGSAVRLLKGHDIGVRAFILLRPPFLDEAEGLHWAKCSIDYAFSVGVECCVLIPTRTGNGAMEQLRDGGQFYPPRLASLEQAVEHGLERRAGRVFADLWDIEKFFVCSRCDPQRARRLEVMNRTQSVPPPLSCECPACHDP